MLRTTCCRLLAVTAALSPIRAQAPVPAIDPAGIPGTLLIHGGGGTAAVRDRFVELAGGTAAHIVVIPTASAGADAADAAEQFLAVWRGRGAASLTLLHTRDRAVADTAEFVAPLRGATGVWFSGGQQSRIAAACLGTALERELLALLRRGGVIGGTSAGAAIQSRTMIAGGRGQQPELATGLDLLPLAIVDQHFVARQRQDRLLAALALRPGHFGLGVDERTAVEVRGRTLRVLGESVAVLALAAGAGRPERIETLRAGQQTDLVTWQRCALARAGAPFPPAEPVPPVVANGTVILGGGGRFPREAMARFLTAAGGPDAPIVVVPTAAGGDADDAPGFERALAAAGARNVRVFHAAHPRDVPTAANLDFLRTARGVWFGGGRQWRLVDAYAGTEAEQLFRDVLDRGGVIGGSSAGCSIQPQVMVRGNPLGNREILVEGYDRGFGYLPGCAVDQHFFRRGRERDLEELVRRVPQVLGIGVDEGAAIVVAGSTMEVLGGRVAVYDRRGLPADAATRQQVFEPGARVELRMLPR